MEFNVLDINGKETGKSVKLDASVFGIEPNDHRTVYRVEAKPVGDLSMLSVGLEGVAKVYIDRRLLFSIWTRGARDWLTIQLRRLWG